MPETELSTMLPGRVTDIDRRVKVVIGHPLLGRGGSESKVMWLIEALKDKYDLTVVTTGGWNLVELNAYYGTDVHEDDVHVRIAPVPAPLRNKSAAAFRNACYQRFAQKIGKEYDIRISTYNLTDWGMPAIHFIADFSWHQEIRKAIDPPSPGFIYRDSLLRKAYLGIASVYARSSGRDVLREDMVIANSRWSAALISHACGVECTAIVYPCVWTEFPRIPWADKEQTFVMIGRIAPEKEVERAIAILDNVRRRGYPIRLNLCGHIGKDRYGQKIAMLCREHADWIIPQGRVYGDRKTQILAHCRFGIQTRSAEPFGISVAEMVKAGAIVFAPNDGGQVEILDHDDLLFQSVDDATDKISAVLSSPRKQAVLRDHLALRSKSFCIENYIRDTLAAVALPNVISCG
jgi:glycosyltransferase involved in cell wall biosynthesis